VSLLNVVVIVVVLCSLNVVFFLSVCVQLLRCLIFDGFL
jgi:hypothetical protein